MRYIIIALASLCILGCKSNNQEVNKLSEQPAESVPVEQEIALPPIEAIDISLSEEAFGDIVELTGEVVETDLLFSPKELDMIIKGDLMIIKTFSSNGVFKVLSLTDMRFVKEFGVKG